MWECTPAPLQASSLIWSIFSRRRSVSSTFPSEQQIRRARPRRQCEERFACFESHRGTFVLRSWTFSEAIFLDHDCTLLYYIPGNNCNILVLDGCQIFWGLLDSYFTGQLLDGCLIYYFLKWSWLLHGYPSFVSPTQGKRPWQRSLRSRLPRMSLFHGAPLPLPLWE